MIGESLFYWEKICDIKRKMPILWEKKENISKFSLLKFLLHMLNINKNLFDIFTKKLNMQTYCKTSCFSWYNKLYVA